MLLGYAQEPIPLNTAAMVSGLTSIQSTRAGTRQDLLEIIRLASEGKLKSVLTRSFKLEQVNEAINLLKAGKVTGRIGLQFED